MAVPRRGLASVLVVDHHRLVAEALAAALARERDLTGRAVSSAVEALEVALSEPPDVALVDLDMPGIGGVETIRRIREAAPGTRLVAMSGYGQDVVRAQALEAGAIGHADREMPLSELPDLVRRAASGESVIDGEEARRLLRVLRRQRHQAATERQRANRLTHRQVEILQLIADGVAPGEISRRLGVRPATLRTHVQNILTRTGAHSQAEAVAIALRHGKIKPGA